MEMTGQGSLGVLLLLFAGIMAFYIVRNLRSGVFVYRGKTSREKEPVVYWFLMVAISLICFYVTWTGLSFIFPGHISMPTGVFF